MISRGAFIVISFSVVSVVSAQETKQKADEGVIDPKADAALRRMSDYVGGLKSFSVNTTTVDEKVTTDGEKIQEIKESKVAVKRPGQMRIDRVGPHGRKVFVDDGKRFTLYDQDANVYASEAAPPTLDAAVDAARERLQVDAPAGDLIVTNSYQALVDGLKVGRYIGREPIDGVMTHHLAMTRGDVSYQLWIVDGPQPLPVRYVITSKDMPGHPQFTIEMRDWQPNASIADNTFAFKPPKDAKQVAFVKPTTSGAGQQP